MLLRVRKPLKTEVFGGSLMPPFFEKNFYSVNFEDKYIFAAPFCQQGVQKN
jgi:hypothetical protein